eukprot:tig00000113_g5630.t1
MSEGGGAAGETLQGPLATNLARLLIQILIILFLSRSLGYAARRWMSQPMVIAEIISGLMLGPTALGRIPGFSEHIFPPLSREILQEFADVGLLLFMFLIGLELNPKMFKAQRNKALVISVTCIALPFALGAAISFSAVPAASAPAALALALAQLTYSPYLHENQSKVPFQSFVLFVGVSMTITAFPVLARIIAEGKLITTRVGVVTLAAAAANDVIGWIILAFAVSIASSGGNPLTALWITLETSGFMAGMFVIVRPLLNFIAKRISGLHISQPVATGILACIFASSWATEAIGIHGLFGAFTFGAIFPKEDRHLMEHFTEKIEDLTVCFLLPLYFVATGLKTDLGLLSNESAFGVAVLVLFIACVSKVLGGLASGRMCGLSWRESLTLGVLMNTRGLVGLIVLNIGHDAGILNDTLFAALVVMALVSTFATAPIVRLIYPVEKVMRTLRNKALVESPDGAFHVLVAIDNPAQTGLVTVAHALGSYFKGGATYTLLHLVDISDRPSSYMHDLHAVLKEGPAAFNPRIATIVERARILRLKYDVETVNTSDAAVDIAHQAKARDSAFVLMGWSAGNLLAGPGAEGRAVFATQTTRDLLASVKSNLGVLPLLTCGSFLHIDREVGLSVRRVVLPFHGPASGLVGSGTVKTARLLARTPGVTVYLLQLVHSSEDPRPQMEEEQLVKKKCSARFQFLRRVALDLTDILIGFLIGFLIVALDLPDLAIEESVKGYDLAIVPAPRDSPPPSMRPPLRIRRVRFALHEGVTVDARELDVERFVRGTQLSVLVVHARAPGADAEAEAEAGESAGARARASRSRNPDPEHAFGISMTSSVR